MSRDGLLVIALYLSCCAHGFAQTQEAGEARGETLYAAHCRDCHTAEVHWRDQKLVSDWSSLKAQVRRWQSNIGVDWREEDIDHVARYLNSNFYRFTTHTQSSSVVPGN